MKFMKRRAMPCVVQGTQSVYNPRLISFSLRPFHYSLLFAFFSLIHHRYYTLC